MLMIIMHNRKDYLSSLLWLMNREDVIDATIVEKESIGSSLIGKSTSFIFHSGGISSEYDRALIAVVDGEEKAKYLLDLIENDTTLNLNNVQDRGFICTLPFQKIRDLELMSNNTKGQDPVIKINRYLEENRILTDLNADKKEDAIKEISALLKDAKQVVDFDTFVEDVLAREKIKTTGIGDGVAIPHTRSDAVKDFVIALGRSTKGIGFDSINDQPAKLIFLIGAPKGKNTNDYLKLLAHLSALLKEEAFRNALLNASSPKEIMDEFKKAEE